MSGTQRIACIGAGPASLWFAILAKRARPERRVVIFERQPEGAALGWGVTLYLDALDASEPETARAIRADAFHWRDNIVHVAGRSPVVVPTPGHSIGRTRSLAILIARARALGVELCFEREIAAGAPELNAFDLVVAADGLHSVHRDAQRETFGTTITRGTNKYVWLGTSRVFDAFTFPFVKTHAGWIWAYAYGFDDRTSTFIVEAAPHTWRTLGFHDATPEEAIAELQQIFAFWLEGHPLWPPPGTRGSMPWLEFETVTNRTWHAGRLVLMGDAAHTTHFTIGSGTRLAIADAIALASAIDVAELPAALAAYEAGRIADLRRVQHDARNSAAWYERLPRYIERDPESFAKLLYARSSRILPFVPPNAFLTLRQALGRA